jgi:hypothetical protein
MTFGRTKKQTDFPPLKDLSEIFADEDIKRCSCGSAAFFDWGIIIMESSVKYPEARFKDFTGSDHVKICVGCQKPVLLHGGDLYDASEYVDKAEIGRLIEWSQTRKSLVPAKIMDP